MLSLILCGLKFKDGVKQTGRKTGPRPNACLLSFSGSEFESSFECSGQPRTIAILVEEGKGFFEFRDLLIGQLRSFCHGRLPMPLSVRFPKTTKSLN